MSIKELYPRIKKDLDLDLEWAKKLETLMRNLCIIENKYKQVILPIIIKYCFCKITLKKQKPWKVLDFNVKESIIRLISKPKETVKEH